MTDGAIIMSMTNGDDDDGLTTINVKGVRKSAWEVVRRGAQQDDASIGEWLNNNLPKLGKLRAGDIKGPGNREGNRAGNRDADDGNPPEMTPDQVTARMLAAAQLMQGAAAVKGAKIQTGRNPVLSAALGSLMGALIHNESVRLPVISGNPPGKKGQEPAQIGLSEDAGS